MEATDVRIAPVGESGVEPREEVSSVLTLDRWTPLRELDRMERRMRRLFEDRGLLAFETPATDVYETDADYVVELEVPGFDRDELTVEVSDHTLVVTGKHEEDLEKAGRELLLHERLERRFERSFELPAQADADKVVAACDKGVLTLHVPKTSSKPKPKAVEITTPEPAAAGLGADYESDQVLEHEP